MAYQIQTPTHHWRSHYVVTTLFSTRYTLANAMYELEQ